MRIFRQRAADVTPARARDGVDLLVTPVGECRGEVLGDLVMLAEPGTEPPCYGGSSDLRPAPGTAESRSPKASGLRPPRYARPDDPQRAAAWRIVPMSRSGSAAATDPSAVAIRFLCAPSRWHRQLPGPAVTARSRQTEPFGRSRSTSEAAMPSGPATVTTGATAAATRPNSRRCWGRNARACHR